MPLADRVSVSRRFRRAIRIDTDLGDPAALDGFVCPRSFAVLLDNMARHISESGQGAFTWTGPLWKRQVQLSRSSCRLAKQRRGHQGACGIADWRGYSVVHLDSPPPA